MSDPPAGQLENNGKPVDPSKTLRLMLAFFGEAQLPQCEEIPAPDVPEPYRKLLVHNDHMTVTLEEHYQDRVVVRPYHVHRQGDLYGRQLDLTTEAAGEVVMTGIMLINLGFCTERVRDLIIAEKTPLGRILIENNILRSVSAGNFLRVAATDPLVARFHLSDPKPAYGRLATIFCNDVPAVDLLEIVRP